MVRLWLFERAEGLVLNKHHIITGVHEVFLRNLDDVMLRAEREGLCLYLCFTDTWKELLQCPSPVKNEHQREAYLEQAVRAIARRFKGNDIIWAYDVFNEIESQLVENPWYGVSIEQAKEFVRKTVETIKAEDSDKRVSCGSGWHGWKPVQQGHYSGLGLDFYDFHVYDDDGTLPPTSELSVDKPVIVGECGPKTKDNETQRRSILAYLTNAVRHSYAGCFVWAYGPDMDGHELVTSEGRQRPAVDSIRHFIQQHT